LYWDKKPCAVPRGLTPAPLRTWSARSLFRPHSFLLPLPGQPCPIVCTIRARWGVGRKGRRSRKSLFFNRKAEVFRAWGMGCCSLPFSEPFFWGTTISPLSFFRRSFSFFPPLGGRSRKRPDLLRARAPHLPSDEWSPYNARASFYGRGWLLPCGESSFLWRSRDPATPKPSYLANPRTPPLSGD